MKTDTLLFIEGVEIENGIKIPEVVLPSGEVLWLEVDNVFHSEVFASFLLGLFEPKKGRALLAGKDITSAPDNAISCVDISRWNPKMETIGDFIKLLAYSHNLQVSSVMSEFKRILDGLGAGYALNIKLDKMALGTKRIVSTAATLSLPFLLLVLIEPFLSLDNEGTDFLKREINRISTDGSSFVILSEYEPLINARYKRMDLRL